MKRSNEKGFSLIESIIHLLIFSMLIQFAVLFFYWQAPIEKVYKADLLGEWELFSLELQEMLEEVTVVVEPGEQNFIFHTERGVITIQQYKKMLRKLVDGLGHVPMLMNVESSTFVVRDNHLELTVEMTDGVRKERTFAIGLSTE